MNGIIKFIFTILGAALIGFGLGIVAHKNNVLSASQFEVAIIMSFIAGGFFMALGLPGRKIQQEPPRDQNIQAPPQA